MDVQHMQGQVSAQVESTARWLSRPQIFKSKVHKLQLLLKVDHLLSQYIVKPLFFLNVVVLCNYVFCVFLFLGVKPTPH